MEVYVAAEDLQMGLDVLRQHFAEGHDKEDMSHLYQKCGDDAKQHLFALVCGLDSMVLGETEIFGQVKTRLQTSFRSRCNQRFIESSVSKVVCGWQAHPDTYAYSNGSYLGR